MLQYSRRPFHSCINYYYETDIDEDGVISFLGVSTLARIQIQFWPFFMNIKFSVFQAPFHSCIIYYFRTDIDEAKVISFLWSTSA